VRLLLDTHALLWSLIGSRRLGSVARDAIEDPDNDVYVSPVSAWEIAVKRASGKLPVPPNVASWLPAELAASGFMDLPMTIPHALAVEALPPHHRDPFDRLLVAQARSEGLTLVTSDASTPCTTCRSSRPTHRRQAAPTASPRLAESPTHPRSQPVARLSCRVAGTFFAAPSAVRKPRDSMVSRPVRMRSTSER
jgi:PIN domain nuclease of toxin-antitoxin system